MFLIFHSPRLSSIRNYKYKYKYHFLNLCTRLFKSSFIFIKESPNWLHSLNRDLKSESKPSELQPCIQNQDYCQHHRVLHHTKCCPLHGKVFHYSCKLFENCTILIPGVWVTCTFGISTPKRHFNSFRLLVLSSSGSAVSRNFSNFTENKNSSDLFYKSWRIINNRLHRSIRKRFLRKSVHWLRSFGFSWCKGAATEDGMINWFQ